MQKALLSFAAVIFVIGFSSCSSTDSGTVETETTVTDGYNTYETEDGKRITDTTQKSIDIIPDSSEY